MFIGGSLTALCANGRVTRSQEQIPDQRVAEFVHRSAACLCQTGANVPKRPNLDADFEP
jgi:hypothetical protein